jgi:ATP-dependent helicase/nuclease subunit B
MDEAETQGADLTKLDELAPVELAEHWAEVRAFLSLVRDVWPGLLEAEGRMNPAAHRNEALRALGKRLSENPPDRPVVAAGSTGSIPATAELLGVIARLPRGAVVLPGLDRDLDQEAWQRVDAGHPQFALKQLLDRIGVRREQVGDWTDLHAEPARERLLREVLRPAPTTDAWRGLAESIHPPTVDGLTLLEAADSSEEATLIALMMRELLETPDKRAALVTRDRGLARRVTAELGRWEIAIDDSAGQPLSHTPAGSFLCLLAEAANEKFAPVPLLALLKHPFAAMGDAPVFRAMARELDRRLRGPRPDSGLAGIAVTIQNAPNEVQTWFGKVSHALEPFERVLSEPQAGLVELLKGHTDAADAMGANMWSGPDGLAANRFIRDLFDAAGALPEIETRSYASMMRDLMDEVPVRPAFGRHPRLAILGPLEARLQSFDLVILGGLNEGSWPASASDDPWFSRPMRGTLGLDQPERAIGLSAHDFASLAAQPRVALTRAVKSEGTPMVASRWVQRLQQLTKGLGIAKNLTPLHHIREIARLLSDPGRPEPAKPPHPCPAVSARPRKLSVTEIETWVRDPYAIYAKRVLRLKPLDPIDADIGPMERGTALHAILERFVRRYPTLPQDAEVKLAEIVDEVLHEHQTPRATLAVWRPRFLNAAKWFVDLERERRPDIVESFVEVTGSWAFKGPAGEFVLTGKADRIDRLRTGGGAIIDYKTGAPPSSIQVTEHLAPQLPLEGAMLANGGFREIGPLSPEQLLYIKVTGAATPGECKPVKADAVQLSQEAAERLTLRVAEFDNQGTGYESRVAPFRSDIAGDYDHLARVREWSVTGWSGE